MRQLRRRDALVAHAGQDVVAGAVHDAEDLGDAGRAEAFAQGLDDGNATGNGGLEAELRPIPRPSWQANAVVGEECLVGSDDVLASGNGGFDG